jgi:hypothetical protein
MGFPEPPMPQHISKEEQVKDLNLIKIQYTLPASVYAFGIFTLF